MYQETPIFSRLVAERGDVPAEVRGEAERIHRDLAHVMRPSPAGHLGAPHHTSGPAGPRAVL
ncbi:hypothetical protein ABZ330_17295 [Streptomyces sp. NPDC006172]|uniref:hypothetical protein n=1 Tax=Streptomyces sp. NPDC006172 TaxID=3154470 RepID=UPI00340AAE22